ncbi:sensor histidine kinase [Actinokineospora auranticolor]|uniref:histidine kinase n=1 Tax=Actinokineospora auranticolor TaxID=155976 RepID=A0A2S6GNK8_9PSEU|nr:sensor histidine kinase [Actinokineospora auranticolor]PPK66797.1 sensor histidine kinase regulating citrate/malate metabolism [Actinokineospora auranticolor]
MRGRWSVARQLLVLQVVIVGVLVAAGAALAWVDVTERTEAATAADATVLARAVADAPSVVAAVTGPDPTAVLQPYTERLRADTGIDFVTIMDTAGTRYTHPNPAMIGGRFLGNTAEALAGRAFTETYTGTLGPSVRAVVPVFDGPRVVALVSAGVTLATISQRVGDRVLWLFGAAGVALLLGGLGAALVARRLRRQTGGMAPGELSRVLGHHEAILHAVREGLVLIDQRGRVTLCNDGGRVLLDLPPAADGTRVDRLGLPESLVERLLSGTEMRDELHLTETRVLVVNSTKVHEQGTVVTIRDRTDLQALTGELNTMRGFAESLRAQAHEAANRLHTVVSLVEMGRPAEAVEFATEELAVAQRLTDQVVSAVSEPVVAALLLGKAADAAERGVDLVITPDSVDFAAVPVAARELVTILGNLIDNAVDAAVDGARDRRPEVRVSTGGTPREVVLRVADSGPGLPPEAFRRGWSTKADGRGLGLALVGQAVRRAGGVVEVTHGEGTVFTVRLPVTR